MTSGTYTLYPEDADIKTLDGSRAYWMEYRDHDYFVFMDKDGNLSPAYNMYRSGECQRSSDEGTVYRDCMGGEQKSPELVQVILQYATSEKLEPINWKTMRDAGDSFAHSILKALKFKKNNLIEQAQGDEEKIAKIEAEYKLQNSLLQDIIKDARAEKVVPDKHGREPANE